MADGVGQKKKGHAVQEQRRKMFLWKNVEGIMHKEKTKETSYTKGKHNKKEEGVEIIERERRKSGADGKAEEKVRGSKKGDVSSLFAIRCHFMTVGGTSSQCCPARRPTRFPDGRVAHMLQCPAP